MAGDEATPGRLAADEPAVEQRPGELAGQHVDIRGGRQLAAGLCRAEPRFQQPPPTHTDLVHGARQQRAALRAVERGRQHRPEVARAQQPVDGRAAPHQVVDQIVGTRDGHLAADGLHCRQVQRLAVGELPVDRRLGDAGASRDRLDREARQPFVAQDRDRRRQRPRPRPGRPRVAVLSRWRHRAHRDPAAAGTTPRRRPRPARPTAAARRAPRPRTTAAPPPSSAARRRRPPADPACR